MTCRFVSRNFELLVLGVCLVFTLLACVSVLAGQAMDQWVKLLPAQGYSPPSVVILRAAPPKALICAEPEWGGTLSCLTVGEIRVLAQGRKAK